jgi:methyltransferase
MSAEPVPVLGLAILIGVLAAQRLFELWLSARHLPSLLARGAVERGASDFAGIVALHALFPLAIFAEVVVDGARPPSFWAWLIVPVVLAAALRIAAMRALGDRWHVRVWVVPGEAPVRRGIYRWLSHPNYVAVVLEFAVIPLLFGAVITAGVASLVNGGLLAMRIQEEERALRWAAEVSPSPSREARLPDREESRPARGPATPTG